MSNFVRKPLVTRRVVEEKQVTYPNGEDEYPDSSSQNDSKASDGMDTKMYEGLEDYFRLFNDGDTSDSKNDSISENNLSPDKEENKRSKTPELEQLNVDEHGNVILPEGKCSIMPIAFLATKSYLNCKASRDARNVVMYT